MGKFDPAVYEELRGGSDPEAVRTRLEEMVGPSGFMLFRISDHGALLRLVGQNRKAIQYLLGNPPFAIRMTQHDIRTGLYAPLRVLVYEDEAGKTCVEYDRPSSLFGQFENVSVTAGHSLGEIASLAAAGAIPWETALLLVKERGRIMAHPS